MQGMKPAAMQAWKHLSPTAGQNCVPFIRIPVSFVCGPHIHRMSFLTGSLAGLLT